MFRLCLCVLFFGTSAMAQAPSVVDLGKPIEAYVVEPGYIMTVQREDDGSIKTLMIERGNAADSNKIDHDDVISDEARARLVDRLVPADQRGQRIPSPWYGLSIMGGGMAQTNYSYEHVSIVEFSTVSAEGCRGRSMLVISWPRRTAPPAHCQSN